MFSHNVCSLSNNFGQFHALLTELNIRLIFFSKTNFYPIKLSSENHTIKHTLTESIARGSLLHVDKRTLVQDSKGP